MKFALCVLLASCAFTLDTTPAPAVDAAERDCAQREDKDVAIQGCSKVIQRGRALSERICAIAYTNRAVAYYHKGDLDSALADYNDAIRLDPTYERAYDDRGNVYRRKGDLDRALADYNQAIHLDPKYAAAYDNRGNSYFERGDWNAPWSTSIRRSASILHSRSPTAIEPRFAPGKATLTA